MRFGMAEAKQDRRDRGRGGGPPEFPELLQRAEALVPVLRERAGKAEELRRLPEETIEDLHRSGLFRILQPRRVGGSELPFRSIVELGSVISRGDGSTGWVLANLAAHHWLLGMWPKQAQDEIWGESPDNLIDSALIFPRGRATPAPGGYRLTGRWPFSSGVDAASWSLIGAIVHDQEAGTNEPRIFVLPASDFVTLQIHLGEAGAVVDAARSVMLGDCDEATRIVEEGNVPSLEQRARYRRDGAYAATLCTKAVDVLFQATGGGAIYARNPLQRAFRDVHAANAHYVLNWDINGAMYGRVALGLSPDATI